MIRGPKKLFFNDPRSKKKLFFNDPGSKKTLFQLSKVQKNAFWDEMGRVVDWTFRYQWTRLGLETSKLLVQETFGSVRLWTVLAAD